MSKQREKIKVKLAEERTIMAEFQKERTEAFSEMFRNEYGGGIFPTSKCFIRLDKAVEKALNKQAQDIIKELEGNKKIQTWVNCQKHNLTTPLKELKKCKECYWEIDEIEAREFNDALLTSIKIIEKYKGQIK